MQARVTRTRASVGSVSRASGTFSMRTSPAPYMTVARIVASSRSGKGPNRFGALLQFVCQRKSEGQGLNKTAHDTSLQEWVPCRYPYCESSGPRRDMRILQARCTILQTCEYGEIDE